MKKSYLFVESPLQLLNAYEAIHKFNLKNYKIIIRLSNHIENDKQIKFLVKQLNLNNFEFILINSDKKTINDIFKILINKYKYKFQNNIDKVFIGNYDSGFFKIIMKQFNKDKIILLDDGSKTLAIQKQFSKDCFYNLFTIYDIAPFKGQKIYKNEYKGIRIKLQDLKVAKNKILFLGAKLSEIGIIEEKKYIELLQKISRKYNDKTIIYITHRGESKNKLQKIEKIENIDIKRFNFPIELLGLFETSIPCKVASFYSTAVLTIKYLYNIEAECFLFNYSSSKYREDIDSVYSYYSKFLKVTDIND